MAAGQANPPASRSAPSGPILPSWIVVWAVLLASFVILRSLWLAWPLDVHLRDDSYYNFCWARSLAMGTGPCVTEGVPTTGVHVLYPALLAVWSWCAGAAALPTVSVGLGMGLYLLSAVLVARFAVRSGAGKRVATLVAATYAGSPYLAGEMIHGQTGLACCAAASFLLIFDRGSRWFLFAGLLAVWARSDLIFLIAAVACADPRERARRGVLTGLILLGYFAVYWWIGGRWLQDSAEPIPWLMAQERAHQGLTGWDSLWPGLKRLAMGIRFRLSSTPLAIAFLGAAVLGCCGRGSRRQARWFWLLLGGVALVAFHDLWRGYPRDYYFAPLGTCGAFALVALFRWAPRFAAIVAVLGIIWNAAHALDPPRTYPWQREMTMVGRVVDDVLPPEARLGCFNSGIVTWHRQPTINLDGVVHRAAFEALREGEMWRFLREQRVDFVADNPVQFALEGIHSNGRHFGAGFDPGRDLEECVRFVAPESQGRRGRAGMDWLSLYRVAGRGAALRRMEAWGEAGLTDLGPVPGGRAVAFAAAPGHALKARNRIVLTASDSLFYVVFLPWDGAEALVVEVEGVPGRTLKIAPR